MKKKIRWWRIDRLLYYVTVEQLIVAAAFESWAYFYWKASYAFHISFLAYNVLLGLCFYLLARWVKEE